MKKIAWGTFFIYNENGNQLFQEADYEENYYFRNNGGLFSVPDQSISVTLHK